MSIEKYNRVKETPTYQVTRKKIKELEPMVPYKLLHIGVYQSQQYGVTCYMDVDVNGVRVRCSAPRRYVQQFDTMCHDDDVMRDIHDGRCTVMYKPFVTRSGFETCELIFRQA